MSAEKTPTKSKKKDDMAFVAPVVRKDYPIFMAGPVERKTPKTSSRSPKDPGMQPAGSQSDRRKRLEQHKDRRARRYPKKKAKIVLRKISEINEEIDEEELYFDEMQKGFTRLRRVTECSESDEEEEQRQRDPSPEVSPQPHKKKLFGLFVWKPFSFKKKSPRSSDE